MPIKPYLLRVQVAVKGFVGYLFTGKLVKTILIRSNPHLARFFEPIHGSQPKPVHISTLFAQRGNGLESIYSYAVCKNKKFMIKCEGPPSPVVLDGVYSFYFGFQEGIIDLKSVAETLLNYSECFEFMNQRVCAEVLEIDILDPINLSAELLNRVLESKGMKVVFASPTMLRDPLRPTGRYKTYLPTPFNVFATPVYTILYTKGQYTVRKLRSELLRLHRLFSESYSVLGGVRVRWVYYGRSPEPALVGFVNYRLNHEYLEYLKQKGVDVESWLGEILAYTLALGVGAGRAAGFGHVDIKPLGLKQAPEQPGG